MWDYVQVFKACLRTQCGAEGAVRNQSCRILRRVRKLCKDTKFENIYGPIHMTIWCVRVYVNVCVRVYVYVCVCVCERDRQTDRQRCVMHMLAFEGDNPTVRMAPYGHCDELYILM